MQTKTPLNESPDYKRENFWKDIAADPEKLKYWREISRLWRGSLERYPGVGIPARH